MARADLDFKVVVTGQEKLEKLYKNVDKVDKAAKKAQGTLPKASNNIRGFGRSALAATTGIKTMDGAIKAALGPVAALMGAVAGLGAAFKTIAGQDFAVAKIKTLGVNSEELVGNLKQVSKELNGSASVAELTGAAYDVASAGFTDAADNAKVLKAAALGAAGGFTDMNTAGNALTSVLNAYGLAASDAEKIMDQFVQTQNDGKIVVAEYARNISKVAPVAAGLGIELAEVNAIISQVTAGGTSAEVAFTGLKTALAQLASGNANKALKQLGIEVTTADLKSKGLIGVLREIEASGVDVGTAFKAFGNEAAPVLQAVFNDIDKTNKLLENQENSVGVAAKAHSTATDTIQGAWKRITTVFENFFTDQTVFGTLIKEILNYVAGLLEGIAGALNMVLAPFKKLLEFVLWVRDGIQKLATAFGEALRESDGFVALQAIFAKLKPTLDAIGKQLMTVMGPAFETLLKWAGMFAEVLGKIVYHWLDLMIKGLVQVGKIIPGLGGAAKDIEKGWQEIKDTMYETQKPLKETKLEAGKLADAIDPFREKLDLISGEAYDMWELLKKAPMGWAEANLKAEELKEVAKGVTLHIKEQTQELEKQNRAAESLAGLQFKLGQERLKTEMALNDVLLQQAERQLQGAKNAKEKEQAAKRIYELTISQAKLELQAAKAAIAESVRKVEAQRDLLVLKAKQVAVEVQLAEAAGVATQEHQKAVALAVDAVVTAQEQVVMQSKIAAEQMKQAEALYKGKEAAAKAAYEQNKVWENTKKAASSADEFANNMSKAAGQAERAANAVARASSYASTANSSTIGGKEGVSNAGQVAGWKAAGLAKKVNGEWVFDMDKYQKLSFSQAQRAARQMDNAEKDYMKANPIKEYASGGYIRRGEIGIVGERGPELVEGPATVTSNPRLKAAMAGDGGSATAGATVQVTYNGETINFDGQQYIRKADVGNMINAAVKGVQKQMAGNPRYRLESGMA